MNRLVPPLNARDHIRGNPSAPVTLVEFGDYQCPYCGQAHPIVKALLRTLGDQLAFAFRHFPLSGMHPFAFPAALAAEAAGAQGRFWPMHDLLYQNQDALDLGHLQMYAETLRLDVRRFTDDLIHQRHREAIRAGLYSGARSGVHGTPTFFINGQRHDGPWDFESLYRAITDSAWAGMHV